MQLVGMLDSPFVRRVAIVCERLGAPYKHLPISLFRHIPEFKEINPLLKAPTLVTDDKVVLTDSNLILDYVAAIAPGSPSLWPAELHARARALHTTGVALTICEKAVQLHYERALRPPEKRHEPWLERVRGQLSAGLGAMEREPAPEFGADNDPAVGAVTLACAIAFIRNTVGDLVDLSPYSRLADFSAAAEARPEFARAPAKDGVVATAAR